MMKGLPGFKIVSVAHKGRTTEIYRGYRTGDQVPVFIKTSTDLISSARLSHEFRVLRHLEPENVDSLPLLVEAELNTLVMKDFGGQSLDRLEGKVPGSLAERLKLLIGLAGELEAIHEAGIIHNNINPSNLVWNPARGNVQIIDYGIATKHSWGGSLLGDDVIEGSLAFIAPERTGRMNRSPDYRSDYYSLGLTFYQILTGVHPFVAHDLNSWIYQHLAAKPSALFEHDPGIPRVLSDIVLTLIQKEVEKRYQSLRGLIFDLEKCLDALDSQNEIEPFSVGSTDTSGMFRLPQGCIGRESEKETLIEAVAQVRDGQVCMVCVAGLPGVGKTTLIRETHKPIVIEGGYFISGKFEQFNRDIPYAALVHAFKGLVSKWLGESATAMEKRRQRLQKAFGMSGKLITNLIPEVERITGKQPPMADLSMSANSNRFELVFSNFLSACATPEEPLVIFLDDLQWIDLPSLKLLRSLIGHSQIKNVLFLGAYRDSEVEEDHPLATALGDLQRLTQNIEILSLAPFTFEQTLNYISKSIGQNPADCREPARACYQKTNGNPFYLKQFLQSLADEGILHHERKSSRWVWDLVRLNSQKMAENVAEFLAEKVKKLPKPTQDLVLLGACIGNTFDIETLAMISKQPKKEAALHLEKALEDRLLAPLDGSHFLVDADSPELVAKYRFLHDRIQQTAYELMGDTGRMATHLELGRLLVRNAGVTGPKTLEAWTKVTTVFEIANHLNKSVTHISDPEEREQLMIINWIAAKKAIASVAYQEAFAYLRFSLTLLPQNAWRHDYQTALVIHNDAATAAFLSGNDAQMEHLLAEIVDNSNTDTDAGSAYDVLLKARISQNRHADALEGACSVLGRLGVDLPSDCSSEEVNREFDLLIAEIDRVGTDRISAQSKMDDCQALLAMRLLRGIVPITAAIGPSLHQLVIVRMVSLTLKRGLCEDSAMGFVSLAMLLCRRRDEDRMTQMSDMATWLSKRYPSKELQVYIDHIASTLWAWKKPLLDVGDEELEISYAAVEAGEFGIAGFALLFYLTYLSLVGKDLDHACKEFEKCLQLTHRIKQHYVAQFLQIFFQALENVRGTQENPHDLAGPHYDESVMPAQHLKNKDVYSTIYYHYNKMFLCCLFGRYQEAVDQMRPIESLLPFIQDHVLLYQVHYYYGLACLALSHDVAPAKRDILFDAADQSIEKVEWAAQWGPMNFKHKHHFLAAERAWALSDRPGARTHFKTAARLATENNHILDAGHVWERLGLLWLAEDEPEAAGVFLNRAHGAYRACGAKAKILMLEKQFSISLATNHFSTTKNAGVRVEAIDLNTFLKASRAIMGNMVLDNLLESMMVIICENVCARKGSFLMDKDGKWTVCVRYAHERGPEICSRELSDFQPGELPKSLIEFVINSKDPMVLENASESGGYLFDPYIKKRRSKSVMCVPVINQGKLLGVLFLENSLNVGVFTTQRLEVLKMLASLAAISVENATLYSRLEQKVAQRTAEVRKKNLQLVSSLTYAKRIQDAILPELENVRHVFPHSFCLFRPCGLVSGDFFWFNRYRSYAFLAVFDCTGHGVPGAFMSMIGNTLLHHIISLEGIFDPAMIFEYLNTEVRRVLKQETGQATDGMDGALCRYDLEAKTLVFCGARRPVYLNLPHQSGIVEIKGSRKSIGGRQRRSPNHFVNHEIDLVDGLTMYLCTDGFADQPNVDGKKIGTRRFKQLLNSMSGVSMLDQERVLSSQLDFFTQGIEQRDDITVLGVRF